MKELEGQLTTLSNQLDESVIRLNHKLEEAEARRNQLKEAIQRVSEERIGEIRRIQDGLLKEVLESKLEDQESSNGVQHKITELQKTVANLNFQHVDDNQKVTTWISVKYHGGNDYNVSGGYFHEFTSKYF